MQAWFEEPGLTRETHFQWEMREAKYMCLNCGFIPVEGMRKYLLIHGEDARCASCEHPLPSVEDINL